MPLNFPGVWRFKPPANDDWLYTSIPDEAIHKFKAMIDKTATQGSRQKIIEHFKSYFCTVVGEPHVWRLQRKLERHRPLELHGRRREKCSSLPGGFP